MGRDLPNDKHSDFVIDKEADSGNNWEASQRHSQRSRGRVGGCVGVKR